MSVNDPDGQPDKELSMNEFIEILINNGWTQDAAENEWDTFPKPVYISDLRW